MHKKNQVNPLQIQTPEKVDRKTLKEFMKNKTFLEKKCTMRDQI